MLQQFGSIGGIIAAILCFVPPIFVLFGIGSIGGLLGYADYILMPLLVLFAGVAIYTQHREKRKEQQK